MRTEVIRADTIEAAVERILDELKDTRRSRENAIYFDGWEGLGASAVLRAVAQRLTATTTRRPTGLEFEQIIHIDCSKWQSRRAMQRAIAEQLKLPSLVMDMFDKQDEEDDFNGVDQGSRAELAQVAGEISQTIQNRTFLVILHNGSNEEIDMFNLGLSLYGYGSKKMLWTFRGRFRLDPKMRDKVTNSTADVVLSASRHERDPQELWSYLVREEATELVAHHCNHGGITLDDSAAATQVAEYLWYMLERSYVSQHIIDYGWALHTSNYLVCDGIILTQQQQAQDGVHEAAWQLGDALHRDMELYIDYLSNKLPPPQQAARKEEEDDLHSHVKRSAELRPYWISKTTCGFVLSPAGIIPSSMFQHSDRLGVLKLSRCTFRFSSPPFLCCHSLRFLWLDRCQDQDLIQAGSTTDHHHHADGGADAEKEDNTTNRSLWACFESLWVLDLSYTDWDVILSAQMMDLMTQLRELNIMGAKNWDMSHLRGRLRNIRKLRVTKSTCCNYSSSSFLSGMERMELLEFSANHTTQEEGGMTCLSGAAVSSSLKTFIIDGSVGLQKINLHSCAELKNLLLRGLFRNLEELDLSGTTLQTIDLSQMQIPELKRLLLIGCEQLRAILWPPEGKRPALDVLRIDTTSRSASANGRGEENLAAARLPSFNKWRISLTDARLLRSLLPVKGFFETFLPCHIDIRPAAATVGGSSDEQVQIQPHTSMVDSKYADVFNIYGDGLVMWDCPEMPLPSSDWPWMWLPSSDWPHRSCLIEIMQGGQGSSKLLEGAQTSTTTTSGVILVPDFICDAATSLHVYDNSFITSIPAPPEGSTWPSLRWCRVERCPKLYTVFTTPQRSDVLIFWCLRTFWASQLPAARYVWNWPAMPQYEGRSFQNLEFLHLDYCPRLIHVLPLSTHISTLYNLHTLEIMCCGDLTEVFPSRQEQQTIIRFPSLARIHLHELPKLQRICGRTMSAPNLETVNIRGCWSLRRLPAVGDDDDTKPKPPPTVDCEKEWWDSLEWDGVDAKHHPSLYGPNHSDYNKTQLPKGSLLR